MRQFQPAWLCVIALALLFAAPVARAEMNKPNVVLILMDNLGWGEIGAYGGGIIRGAPTPRIDSLAEEGMKLLNFNVEAQCTPSRAAIMTGRYAIRSGNGSVPLGEGVYGLTRWEYTMAEMLSDAGYDTAMFGKWHLGDSKGRYPTDQGFDEWYGIPNSTDEAFWADSELFREGVHPQVKLEYVMEGRRGSEPKKLGVYDLERRRVIDGEITDRAVDFIQRKAKGEKPFFLFIPYTQTHLPVEPSPEFQGKTGNGRWADVLTQLDHYVGKLLDAVEDAGIRDNTIIIFTADNGPEAMIPHQGFGGPWRGSYFTGLEGSLRVSFLIRWPGKIPARSVSNEIVHEMDLFPTFATVAGGKVPNDRIIDGFDQTEFLLGKQKESKRESVIIYVGNDLYGVKWRNWKLVTRELDAGFGVPAKTYSVPLIYNLHLDPKEQFPMQEVEKDLWVRYPASQALMDHLATFKKEPAIKPGTPDPYRPSGQSERKRRRRKQ
jgi:arylsulfatase